MFLGSVFFVLWWSGCDGATVDGGNDISQRIQRGESFLTNLFATRIQLLPEYHGSSTYWLFHDNYLAAHLLARTRPDLSRQIRSTLETFGVTKSGKIEIVFGEASEPLPFRAYVLTNVASFEGKTIQTELATTNILSGWTSMPTFCYLLAWPRPDPQSLTLGEISKGPSRCGTVKASQIGQRNTAVFM